MNFGVKTYRILGLVRRIILSFAKVCKLLDINIYVVENNIILDTFASEYCATSIIMHICSGMTP
jgi:hypothetical protein